MKILTSLLSVVLVLAAVSENSFAQKNKKEQSIRQAGVMTVPISELLYMGKYWRGAKATYDVSKDDITLDDGKQLQIVQWEIAPAALKEPFADFRQAEQAKLNTPPEPPPVKLPKPKPLEGLTVTGTVRFVLKEGILVQHGRQIIMIEGVEGFADGETYSGRVRRTDRVYQYLLDYGMVATKRIYEPVTKAVKTPAQIPAETNAK